MKKTYKRGIFKRGGRNPPSLKLRRDKGEERGNKGESKVQRPMSKVVASPVEVLESAVAKRRESEREVAELGKLLADKPALPFEKVNLRQYPGLVYDPFTFKPSIS